MTQDEAAKHLGVSRPTFVQIEAGNRSLSSLELDKLALLFGRNIREFVADSFQDQDPLSALFRAQSGIADEPAVLEKLRECMALGRELTNLERLVGIDRDLSTVASYPFPSPKARWDAIQQGQRAVLACSVSRTAVTTICDADSPSRTSTHTWLRIGIALDSSAARRNVTTSSRCAPTRSRPISSCRKMASVSLSLG